MSIIQKLKDLFLIEDEPEEELLAQFRHTVDQEYAKFKDSVLSMDREDIFSLASQINFYDALHEYILYGGPVPNEVLYNALSENPLALMYEYYRTSGMTGIESWKGIRKILELTFMGSEEVLYA